MTEEETNKDNDIEEVKEEDVPAVEEKEEEQIL